MASVQPYGDRWRAVVRRAGFKARSKIFPTKKAADAWARELEIELDRGLYRNPSEDLKQTTADLFQKFAEEVSPGRKGGRWEITRLERFIREDEFTRRKLNQLTPDDIRAWRDRRLKQVSAATVNREMNLISGVFTYAIKEWGLTLKENPVHLVKRPPPGKARSRRWSDADIEAILEVSGFDKDVAPRTGKDYVGWAVLLAIETAMRLGELCSIKVNDVDFEDRKVSLYDTKNGDDRDVPLSSGAMALLKTLVVGKDPGDFIFPLSGDSLGLYFREARKAAGLEDLHFHDTRHEAATRLSRKLSNVLELSAVTGHRSLQALKRYYNPRASELAHKLD